ncbi:DsbA family protein [Kordiimonas sp. SCSIO 12603]|uniref:thioredoxin domain-containing protein n=1 Tax=Kordiimonas sp. SCSIO 12603 TaxID=2829596 RepID=UPI002102E483|nr:thioredoxin domain-containing protein [Kordiimonas sp. SCSIO 12603]UTW58143.1 DsbA family protein [Kordiimonas sp. SCSIO 12603]
MNNKTLQSWFRSASVAVSVLALAACGDSGDTTSANSSASSAEIEVVNYGEGQEGTWGDIVYGNPDAPITVVEYASLVCGYCANYANNVFPEFSKEYIETGQIKFVFRNYLLGRLDMVASAIARCGTEDEAKKLTKLFFNRQGEWLRSESPESALASLARRAVNMSRVKFDKCLANSDMQKNLVQMTKIGNESYDVTGTPSFIVNGKKLDFRTFEELDVAMEEAIKSAS